MPELDELIERDVALWKVLDARGRIRLDYQFIES